MKKKIRIFSLLFCLVAFSAWAADFKSALNRVGVGPVSKMVKLWYDFNEGFKTGKQATEFFDFAGESLLEFDFKQLARSKYFQNQKNVHFSGEYKSPYYWVRLKKSNPNSLQFGDLSGRFQVIEYKGKEEDSFWFKTELVGNSGQWSAKKSLFAVDELLSMLSGDSAGNKLKQGQPIYKNLAGDSRRILNLYQETFPSFSSFVARYTRLSSLVTKKEKNQKKVTFFNLRGRLNMAALQADFPGLYEYLEELGELFVLKTSLIDKNGNRLASFHVNSETREIFWSFYCHQGKIVPQDKAGNLIFKDAISAKQAQTLALSIFASLRVKIYGLNFSFKNIVVRSKATISKTDTFQVSARLTKISTPQIAGSFYHVVPPWLIDIGMPGNMEELANRFIRVLVAGNYRKGSSFRFIWDAQQPKQGSIATVSAETEILDNPFARFAVKVINHRVIPTEDAFLDIKKGHARLCKAWLKDLK